MMPIPCPCVRGAVLWPRPSRMGRMCAVCCADMLEPCSNSDIALPYAVFVFETIAGDGEAEEVGFGAISVFYDRPGYDGVCDLAYYVTARWQRRGVGRFALRTLLNECRARAMRKACAIIFSDNTASNALVESFGFEPFGEMPEAAYDSRGVLHDMSYWCLDLTPLDAKGAVEGIARR